MAQYSGAGGITKKRKCLDIFLFIILISRTREKSAKRFSNEQ